MILSSAGQMVENTIHNVPSEFVLQWCIDNRPNDELEAVKSIISAYKDHKCPDGYACDRCYRIGAVKRPWYQYC